MGREAHTSENTRSDAAARAPGVAGTCVSAGRNTLLRRWSISEALDHQESEPWPARRPATGCERAGDRGPPIPSRRPPPAAIRTGGPNSAPEPRPGPGLRRGGSPCLGETEHGGVAHPGVWAAGGTNGALGVEEGRASVECGPSAIGGVPGGGRPPWR